MPTSIERPQFAEGQILSAADLQQLLDYPRGHDARHNRIVHTWGIAQGLELSIADGALIVTPGMAIDSSGIAILVGQKIVINPQDFPVQSLNQKSGRFSVFLKSRRRIAAGSSMIGKCGTASGGQIIEDSEIEFGLDSEAADNDQQPPWSLDEGPDDNLLVSSRRVLIGFCDWGNNGEIKFSNETTQITLGIRTIRPRYAGVHASDVESISGSKLTLRTKPSGTPDALMLVLDPTSADAPLAFGSDDGNGEIKAVFSVDRKGKITATGLDLPLDFNAGDVFVESGIVHDGCRVPLPNGLTYEAAKDLAIHIQITPRINPPADKEISVLKCFVDDDYQVNCAFITKKLGKNEVEEEGIASGVCNYVVTVSAPSK